MARVARGKKKSYNGQGGTHQISEMPGVGQFGWKPSMSTGMTTIYTCSKCGCRWEGHRPPAAQRCSGRFAGSSQRSGIR